MKKSILALIITSLLGVSGCKEEKKENDTQPPDPIVKTKTSIKFDILSDQKNPIHVRPSYMEMDNDGTLSLEKNIKDLTVLNDPHFAMGQTDGWSPSLPLEINFTGSPIDPASAPDGFYILKSGDPNDILDKTLPVKLKIGIDYLIEVEGNKLKAILLKPLSPSSDYMFAVTNMIKNIHGDPLIMNPSYLELKTKHADQPPSFLPLQTITQVTEENFNYIGVDKSSIVFSSWFTTASVGDVLYGAKMATARAIKEGANKVWKGSAIAAGILETDLANLYTLSVPVLSGETMLKKGDVYKGKITLPYFLEITHEKFLTSPWKSGMPNVEIINHILNNGQVQERTHLEAQLKALNIDPLELKHFNTDPATQARLITALTGSTLTLANGTQLDPERIITRYNPIPKLKSIQQIEYTLILPKDPKCQKEQSNGLTFFLHGVTSDKETLHTSRLADALIEGQCRALIAINHPLHGDRKIDNKNATDDPSMYINLHSLTTIRDNMRQSTIDMVNLRASVGKMFNQMTQNPGAISTLGKLGFIDPKQPVGFLGHSLGAMMGVSFGNVTQRTTGDPQIDQIYFNIDKLALANPGAQIPYVLINSKTFNIPIKTSMYMIMNKDFQNLCNNIGFFLCIADYALLEGRYIISATPSHKAKLENMYQNYHQYSYEYQTVLDTIDPTNHAPLISKTTAVYLAQVNSDKVIPNSVPPKPILSGTSIVIPSSVFAGTKPLIKLLDLTPTTISINGKLIKNAGLFKIGTHMSLLYPHSTLDVTEEMQSQIHSFINGDGKTLTVKDTSTLEPL